MFRVSSLNGPHPTPAPSDADLSAKRPFRCYGETLAAETHHRFDSGPDTVLSMSPLLSPVALWLPVASARSLWCSTPGSGTSPSHPVPTPSHQLTHLPLPTSQQLPHPLPLPSWAIYQLQSITKSSVFSSLLVISQTFPPEGMTATVWPITVDQVKTLLLLSAQRTPSFSD